MDNLPNGNDLSEIIGKLMADENFGKVLDAVKKSYSANAENDQSPSAELSQPAPQQSETSPESAIPALSPELMSKLPSIMSMLSGNVSAGGKSHSRMDDRKKLLYALKPFLSQRRRDAVDSIVNIASITDLFGI